MELGKAGEFRAKPFFTTSFRTGLSRSTRVRTRPSRVYIVECSCCGKRFPGSDTALGCDVTKTDKVTSVTGAPDTLHTDPVRRSRATR